VRLLIFPPDFEKAVTSQQLIILCYKMAVYSFSMNEQKTINIEGKKARLRWLTKLPELNLVHSFGHLMITKVSN